MNISFYKDCSSAFRIDPDHFKPMLAEVSHFHYSDLPEHHNKLHMHHFHQLDVVLEGEFTLTLEGQKDQTGRPGDAWIIPPLIRHGVNCNQHFRWCSFKFHAAPWLWPFCGDKFRRFHVPPYLCEAIDAVCKRSSSRKALTGQHAAAAIEFCLIELFDQYAGTQEKGEYFSEFHQLIFPLLERIQREPSIRWNVAQMAEEVHLSPGYFSRYFHQIMRKTPQRYIMEVAMREAAANLMIVPPIPIKEIAKRAGYANVQAFTHAFINIFKISPGLYKQQMVQGNSAMKRKKTAG
jgi:AraC-like DNA-binding protein